MEVEFIQFIIIDLFCGAGGTTTGFEKALSNIAGVKVAKVVACINHDHIAIKSHWENHPEVEHFEEDIRKLNPYDRLHRLVEIYRAFYPEAKIILWASLECTNFSKAKGGLPRDADSRTLAEHLYKYIDALNPDYVQIENVVEFMSWGPLDAKGKPISRKAGQDWLNWRNNIRSRGYVDEWKELNSADFGALTSRNRLFGCFAKEGLPIVWPTPSHSKNPEKTTMMKPLKKWNAVKAALDFEDEGNSIFNRRRKSGKITHLSPKTMQRIFMGSVKHIAGGKDAYVSTYNSGNPDHRNIDVDSPVGVITTNNRFSIVKADRFINQRNGGNPESKSSSIEQPARTLTATGGNLEIVKAEFLTLYNSNNGKTGGNHGASVEDPAPVIATRNTPGLVQATFISKYNGVNGGKHDNSNSVEGPIGTLTTGDTNAKVTAVFIDKTYGGDENHQSIDVPAGTIMTNDKHNLVTAEKFIMDTNFNNDKGHSLEDPSPTITASRHHHYIVNPSWFNESARSIEEPCFVVIARQDKAPLYLITCKTGPVAVPVYEDDCEWTVKLKEFMVLYNICDIKMRMLKVPELKKIQGFPEDYVLLGNQTDQKKFIGNAVHPLVPEAWIMSMSEKTFPDQFLKAA